MIQITAPQISIEDDLADIDEAASLINQMEIASNEDLRQAVEMTATIKESFKELEEKRKTWTKPLNDVIKDINATFSPATTALAAAEIKLKDMISAWIEKLSNARELLLESVEMAKEDERPDILAKAEECIVPKVPGLTVKEVLSGEVENRDEIYDWIDSKGRFWDFLVLDEKALLEYLKKHPNEKIPGLKTSKKRTIAITTSKVV